MDLKGVENLKQYVSPSVEFIAFGNSRLETAGSRCDCYTERWNFTKLDWDDDPSTWPTDNCITETKAFIELADAEII